MPRYDVHVYGVVRWTIKDVEARTMEGAIESAMTHTDYDVVGQEFAAPLGGGPYLSGIYYADEVTGYLVDEHPEPEVISQNFAADGVTRLP